MPLVGNTKTYGLPNVLKFLADSQYSGRLRIYFRNRRVDLFLFQGNLRVPLGEEWKPLLSLDELREKKAPQGEPPANLRGEVENAIYNIFLWERANYVFDRDFLPAELEDPAEQQFLDLHAGSLVMEASRRMDDLSRSAEEVPYQDNLFYITSTELDNYDPVVTPYINGSRDIHEVVDSSGKGLYEVVMILLKLLKENKASLLTPNQYITRLEEFVNQKDYTSAFFLYKHILNQGKDENNSHRILFQDIDSEASLQAFSGDMTGFQGLYFLQDLVSNQVSIEIHAKGKQEYTFIFEEGKIYFRKNTGYIANVIERLVMRDLLSSEFANDLRKVPLLEEEMFSWILPSHISTTALFFSILVEEIGELSREPRLVVTSPKPTVEKSRADFLLCQSSPESRGSLFYLLEDWENVCQKAPEEENIVVLVRPAREKYVETNFPVVGEFLSLFHRNRMNLRELREKVSPRISLLEFYSRINMHIELEDLRFLEVTELKKLVTAEIMIENYADAIRLIEAGKLRKEEELFFQEKLEEIRLRSEGDLVAEDDRLVGDLTSFSLAEVLQNLVTNQLTGTLRIFIPNADLERKELYFDHGDIFLLRKEEETSEATVSTFLDMDALGGLASMASEQNRDDYLDELAEVARQEIYELFLWEGATFTFILDALPPEMYHPADDTLKLSLDASVFLMEAIGRLDMWMEIYQVITTEKVIFEFTSPEGKLQALAMGRNPQIVYMIDGIKNVEDLIRVSNMGKLEACSFLYELYQMSLLRPLALAELILRGQEAYKRKDFATALKYYDCAIRFKAKDDRLQKIVTGLRKLIRQNQ